MPSDCKAPAARGAAARPIRGSPGVRMPPDPPLRADHRAGNAGGVRRIPRPKPVAGGPSAARMLADHPPGTLCADRRPGLRSCRIARKSERYRPEFRRNPGLRGMGQIAAVHLFCHELHRLCHFAAERVRDRIRRNSARNRGFGNFGNFVCTEIRVPECPFGCRITENRLQAPEALPGPAGPDPAPECRLRRCRPPNPGNRDPHRPP